MIPELGVIEGYFGRPWRWAERAAVVERLAPAGYRFFHYAPKADERLRRGWQRPHGRADEAAIVRFADLCRAKGMRFGIGLTPVGAQIDFGEAARAALKAKLTRFDAWGIDDLAILFDDMRGDLPDLAVRQADIAHFAGAHSAARRIFLCPSYYSLDPRLDAAFGPRPARYLEELGARLDPAIAIYWTGEEVCSPEIGPAHLRDVAAMLGRKVALWDNYPVNDGPRMAQHLHLRAFTGRPAALAGEVSHHAINPALQPLLGCIPALTLPMLYRQGPDYRYGAAFDEAARAVCGPSLAQALRDDLPVLQNSGLDRLTPDLVERLRVRYAAFGHPAAAEVLAWLDGAYAISGETVRTQ